MPKLSGPKKFTAEEIRWFQKFLHGAPVNPGHINPFSLSEGVNPLTKVKKALKEDKERSKCIVLPPTIEVPGTHSDDTCPEGY